MNDMQQPPAKGGSKLIYILVGCFGCLALMGVGFFAVVGLGIGGFAAMMKAAEPAKVEARAFLAKAAAGDIDGAYDHFHSALKAKKPKDELKAEAEKYKDLFDVTDSTFNSVAFNNDVTTISGTVTGKSGKVHQALFRFREEGGKPRLIEYDLKD